MIYSGFLKKLKQFEIWIVQFFRSNNIFDLQKIIEGDSMQGSVICFVFHTVKYLTSIKYNRNILNNLISITYLFIYKNLFML